MIEIFTFVFIFILGVIIGSFLNVVIYRFNTGKKITKGKSMCMTCGKSLHWNELIPMFSFLFQFGRCRGCRAKISYQYPLVEFFTGVIFTLIAYHLYPILEISTINFVVLLSIFLFIFSILIIICVYDFRHKIIPDSLVYTYIIISFLLIFINTTGVGSFFVIPSIWGVLAGPMLALPFALIWYFSSGKWMGFGDAKLMLGIGWMLGLNMGIVALMISFWIGGIFGIFALIFKRFTKVNSKTEIPFAPFLILGTLIVFLFNINIYKLLSIF
ncbi:TPA: prepilin peptidase [Candidatus Nomurabacteria bacterium]|nr:MAG: Prepilin peptidase-1 [Parcubacteria bacterium RAAC4_OD1_1]HCY26314.1 prepilin peptidase [Candidatus Nomurabacteria bacterium]